MNKFIIWKEPRLRMIKLLMIVTNLPDQICELQDQKLDLHNYFEHFPCQHIQYGDSSHPQQEGGTVNRIKKKGQCHIEEEALYHKVMPQMKHTFGNSCWRRIDDVLHPTISFQRVKCQKTP